jgi:protein ImuB
VIPAAGATRSIVLWCPDWPVFAAAREHGIDPSLPIALTEGGAIHSCSEAARRDGVVRGLRLREAQFRSPDLVVQPYDPVLDVRAFDPLVRQVELTVPGVQILRPGMIAMRARGPARYYGGEDAAARALIRTVAELGVVDARAGVADGPFAAEQAARAVSADERIGIVAAGASGEFLAPMPVGLVVDDRTRTLLNRLGVRTLGEFAALPEDDVRRRFGAAGVFAHQRAAGREATGVAARTPPPEFEVEQHFEPPLDRVDQLAFAFRVRAEEFVDRLRGARLVCTAIRVELDDERGGRSSRSWLHPRWFSAGEVIDRVRWQLQGAGTAETELASSITAVRVVPERVDSTAHHESGLWGGGPDERVHHALTRVQSMLGHDAVVTPRIGGGRMLAEREVLVPWGDRPPEASGAPWPGRLPALAPASVFRERLPVALLDAAGAAVSIDERGALSGPPERFAVGASGTRSAVRAWAGPWPVVERWWDAERARRVHRFQVVDAEGCAWLFVRDAEGWWAEARYD